MYDMEFGGRAVEELPVWKWQKVRWGVLLSVLAELVKWSV